VVVWVDVHLVKLGVTHSHEALPQEVLLSQELMKKIFVDIYAISIGLLLSELLPAALIRIQLR